jgi:putative two-component system response regulator
LPDPIPMATQARHPEARILVVDDEPPNVFLLERILAKAGYADVASTTDPREVEHLVADFHPDLLLLDLHMPNVDGFTVMGALGAASDPVVRTPILVLTADATAEVKHRALAAGARDFLTKPLDMEEVLLRIGNILEIRFLEGELRAERDSLEQRVVERTRDLEDAQTETFERLALAAEFRDDDTGNHTRRVGSMAALIARTIGLPDEDVELLRRAAALHDVGKIGVPDSILLAPRKLTEEEFAVVKTHTEIGARLLSGSRSATLRMAEKVAWSHHERWDGGGYAGIAGEDIPHVGRITTVADVFDALTHARPYKEAWPIDRALEEIERQRGLQFDPGAVDAFLGIVRELSPSELEMYL